MYYAPEIFKVAGAGRDSAFAQTVTVGAVNVLFTFVAIGFVVSFITAIIVVRTFLEYVTRHGFTFFAWWRVIVGTLGVGTHRVELGSGRPLAPGVYTVRLRQAGSQRSTTAVVLR